MVNSTIANETNFTGSTVVDNVVITNRHGVCPSCGRCRDCGYAPALPYVAYPHYPYYQPLYEQPIVTYCSNSGDCVGS